MTKDTLQTHMTRFDYLCRKHMVFANGSMQQRVKYLRDHLANALPCRYPPHNDVIKELKLLVKLINWEINVA